MFRCRCSLGGAPLALKRGADQSQRRIGDRGRGTIRSAVRGRPSEHGAKRTTLVEPRDHAAPARRFSRPDEGDHPDTASPHSERQPSAQRSRAPVDVVQIGATVVVGHDQPDAVHRARQRHNRLAARSSADRDRASGIGQATVLLQPPPVREQGQPELHVDETGAPLERSGNLAYGARAVQKGREQRKQSPIEGRVREF